MCHQWNHHGILSWHKHLFCIFTCDALGIRLLVITEEYQPEIGILSVPTSNQCT